VYNVAKVLDLLLRRLSAGLDKKEFSSHLGPQTVTLTLSLLMSYIYGVPSKARTLTSYIYIYIYIYILYGGFCL
jgi:hypothetical protein